MIHKITTENESRRMRMSQLDAARLVEVAEWEGSERVRSQIPQLHGPKTSKTSSSSSSPNSTSSSYAILNKYLSNTMQSSPPASSRSPQERQAHAISMRNNLKRKQLVAMSVSAFAGAGAGAGAKLNPEAMGWKKIQQTFAKGRSSPGNQIKTIDLATRVRSEHTRRRHQVNSSPSSSPSFSPSSSTTTTPTRSSDSTTTTTANNTRARQFRHIRVASQQWQSPGHVQEVHARLEKIDADHLLQEEDYQPFISRSFLDDYGPDSNHEINHALLLQTYGYAKQLKQEAKALAQHKRENETIKVPRNLFSKLKGFLQNKRGDAYNQVLGLLAMWLPPSFERPTDATVSSIASNKVRTDFQKQYNVPNAQPPFFSFLRMSSLNHENVLDELINRSGQFHCPKNMAMVFPVGRMFNVEENKKISLVVCSVHPGTSYWIDEEDMPGLSREEGHVFLPSGPPDDFESICLLGRRTQINIETGKRRSSVGNVKDPIDPSDEYYRYLVQNPAKRAIAMWCVTFTPKQRKSYGTSETKDNLDNLNIAEEDTKETSPMNKSMQRWEHRCTRKQMSKNQSHTSSFDMLNVVSAALAKEKLKTSSWDNEKEKQTADIALDNFEKKCSTHAEVLQEKLVSLHQQLEKIHLNYTNVSKEIHDDVRNNLTDVKNEKESRKGALNAWKLQLLHTHMQDVRRERISKIAKKELTEEQFDVYEEYFNDIHESNHTNSRPPGWTPEAPPVDSSITHVHLKNHGNGDETGGEKKGDGDGEGKESKVAAQSKNGKGKKSSPAGPSIRVGGKVPKRRASIVDMMDAFKQVGVVRVTGSNKGNKTTTTAPKRRSSLVMREMEHNASHNRLATEMMNEMDMLGMSPLRGTPNNNRIKELQVKEVNDYNNNSGRSTAVLPPMTPEAEGNVNAQDRKKFTFEPSNNSLANKIFKPSSPRVKHHNKNMSLGGLVLKESNQNPSLPPTTSSVPKMLSGWIWKKGQRVKAKKKRWFELTPTQLVYRETKHHSSKRGHMQLQKCVLQQNTKVNEEGDRLNDDLDFQIISPDRILYLTCETKEECNQWMNFIRHNIALSRRRKSWHVLVVSLLFLAVWCVFLAHFFFIFKRALLTDLRSTNVLALHAKAKQYNAMEKTLRKRIEIIAWLAANTTKQELNSVAPSLFCIYSFRSFATSCTLTSYCLAIEIERAQSMSTLFRANSLSTKMLDLVLKSATHTETDLEDEEQGAAPDGNVLNDLVPVIMEAIVQNCRLDPQFGVELDMHQQRVALTSSVVLPDSNKPIKVSMTAAQHTVHAQRMHDIIELCLTSIEHGLKRMSPLKCAVLVQLYDDMMLHFSSSSSTTTATLDLGITAQSVQQYIVMLLFLRLINPALAHPKAADGCCNQDDNVQHVRRGQKMVAQILQKLANGKVFEEGQSNEHLSVMNYYIINNHSRIQAMYGMIQQQSLVMDQMPAKPPLNDDECANAYGDSSFEMLYNSLLNVHELFYQKKMANNSYFVNMTNDEMTSFSKHAQRQVGYDLVGAKIDFEVVLDSLGKPNHNEEEYRWYGSVVVGDNENMEE